MNSFVTFEELAGARRSLGDLCKFHRPSVEAFRPESAAWYLLTLNEELEGDPEGQTRHLSTSASCLESLSDSNLTESQQPPATLVDAFCEGALSRPFQKWESEGAAHTYCRVRTLPFILERATSELVDRHVDAIADHINFIWKEVDARLDLQGIREHEPDPQHRIDVRYPPNAFLTFWGLRTLAAANRHSALETVLSKVGRKRHLALSWAERTIGSQVAFHGHKSDRADPHQLAWAMRP